MEAVSAGAPVLAFIMVALHSTKKVYEAVSDIKNGPDLVEKLAAAVTNLQSVLTQLSNCPAVTSPDPETDLGAILALIKTCSEDVLRYEKQLGKVRTSPDEKGLGRAWKRFMTVLHEKDFQQMSVGVNHHVSALGVHLGLIQSSTASISKRKLVDLNDAISKQAGNDQTQIALLQHQSTDLSIIKDNVNSVTDLSLSIQGQIRETVTPLFQRIEQTAGVSATQYENISVLLQALQHQVSGLVNHSSHLKPVPQSEPQGLVCSGSTDNKGDSKSDHELLNRIERLCQLAKQKEGQKSDNEAEGIIDDLDALLESVSVQLSHSSSEYRPSRKRPIDVVQKEGRNNSRELKRMRSLLTSSDSVLINQKAPRYLSFRNRKIIRQYNMKELETTYGKFIMTTKRRQWSADREASHEGTTNSKATGELTATWKAILDHERFQANITVYLHQITRADGFSSLYPSILVGRIRPDDSPIFSFVHDGNMDGLLSLLSQGKASLRDCNSFGTPLLHYATRQPEMCKFLIENGADVDEYAPFPSQYTPFLSHEDGVLELVSGPPLAFQWWRYAEGGSKSYECQRLLLNAGADPEANTGSANSTFGLQFVIDTGTIESLQLILDLGTSFIDLERKDEWGDTPLLRLAMMSDVECKPAKYDLLLTRGADIKARNNKGKNCLHILMESVFDCESSDEQEALVLLIRKGADVNAVDNFGDSIAKTAYSHEGVYDHLNTYDLGMYRGDLWDAVLSDCGYDIAEMRKGFPRRPRYSCDYTREGFERLWRGREEFCPYYDDPSEWDPEKDLESLTDSKEGISENGSEGEGLQDYSGYGVDNNEEDTQLELPPLRDNGEASVFLTQSLPPYHDIPAVWNREGEIESIERSEECPREGISANRDLQAGSGYDMDTDEGGTEHELPPLRSNEEGNMLSREPLPLLSSIDGATLETSTIEPATSSCWYPDSSQTMVPRNHFQQVSVESNISESVPIWQDWPTTIQTTFPAHSFQRGFVGAVSELEDCELEESNPWL